MEDLKWYAMTVEETAAELKTDISSGLSRKEAARRCRRLGENRVYRTGDDKPFRPVTKMASDVSLIIMLVLSVIGAFFADTRMSVVCIFLTLWAFAFSSVTYLYTKRYFDSSAAESLPTVRVRRDGKVYSVSIRHVVEGDVIILRRGDIVPCDCRLISSENLKALEFTGRIDGREKNEITQKNAGRIFLAGENPTVSQQENMIGASAAVVSGHGIAVAVRCGTDTFISQMKGELELVPDAKKDLPAIKQFSSFASKVALIMLICALPVTLVVFFVGKDSFELLDTLMTLAAIVVTSSSGALTAVMYIIPMVAMMRAKNAENSAQIKFLHAVGELNYNDSVIFYGDEALVNREMSAERIYASNLFFPADKPNDDAGFVTLVENAVLGTSRNLNTAEQDKSLGGSVARAAIDLAQRTGVDHETLKSENPVVEFKSASESQFDTALIKNGENHTVICTSMSSDILRICTHMRTPSGILPMPSDKKNDLIRAQSQLERQAKKVLFVASSDCPTSSLARLALVQNQLIFDGYIEFAAPYVENCRELVDELREADQNVYFFAPESGNSVITAFNTGIVHRKSEIAYASHFRKNGHGVDHGFGEYRAYLGFGGAELRALTRLIRGDNGTVSMICSDVGGLSASAKANALVCVSDETENRRTPTDQPADYSQIIKKNSDVIIPPANRGERGIKSFMTLFACSKTACASLCGFLKYLLFSQSLRMSAAVIPLVVGKKLLLPVQILSLGFVIDFLAAVCFALSGSENGIKTRLCDIETVFAKPLRSYFKYPVAGITLGGVLLLLAAVFGFSGSMADTNLSVLAFGAVAVCQVAAIAIMARPGKSDRLCRILIGASAILTVALIVACVVMPSFGAILGIESSGWQVIAATPIAAVIGTVIINVTDRYL